MQNKVYSCCTAIMREYTWMTASWLWLWPSLFPILNWRPPNRRQEPSEGRSHWLQTGSHSGLHCIQISTGGSSPHRGALTDCKLALTLTFTDPTTLTVAGISIYYYITPTYFRLDHMIFFHLFTQVHLWLTAQSRDNT